MWSWSLCCCWSCHMQQVREKHCTTRSSLPHRISCAQRPAGCSHPLPGQNLLKDQTKIACSPTLPSPTHWESVQGVLDLSKWGTFPTFSFYAQQYIFILYTAASWPPPQQRSLWLSIQNLNKLWPNCTTVPFFNSCRYKLYNYKLHG